ncbi:MAG: exopolysaccharide biosynthesis protein [Alphaproteobacteria bacterium]
MTIRSISELFETEFLNKTQDTLSFREILESVHERGFGFILLLIALPMALPIPVPPGVNILMASPLILLTAQQAIGRKTIWLPQRALNRSISREKFEKMLRACLPWIKRMERIIRPRFGIITQGLFSNLIGICGFVMALSVLIPIPLTNTVPSLGIALMAVGVIMRDGLAVIAGAMIGLLWVGLLTYFALYFGLEGIEILKDTIKSFIR